MSQNTRETRRSPSGNITLLILVPLLLSMFACSGGGSGTDSGGTLRTIPSPTTPPLAGGARPKCDQPTLQPIVQAKFSGATLTDIACNDTQAALTIQGASELKGDGVGLLLLKDGKWVLLASGGVDADGNSLITKEFSINTYNIWRGKYDAIHNPQGPTVPRSFTSITVFDDPAHACDQVVDAPCTPPTSPVDQTLPVRPTTSPTIVAVTEPPTTEGPTIPPTTQVSVSPFCKTHPLDSRCLANPGFPG